MANRRQFIAGLLSTGFAPLPTWADAGTPAYLAAAARPDGSFVLCGISAACDIVFEFRLPARGHAAAAHPIRPEAVAFARRPGTFAVVLDCVTGQPKAMLEAPEGRHFYGHGAFSKDGAWLYTSENDFSAGTGRIGVWDAGKGYARTAEFSSGGIGPHDLKRLPGTEMLIVANGGIDTHPESGRTKLNIATMAPNLAYIDAGKVVETASLDPALHKNSIRHLAVASDETVAFGMQWQGHGAAPALVGSHQRGLNIRLMSAPDADTRAMAGYVGSVAFTEDEQHIVVTSPRGGMVQSFHVNTAQLERAVSIVDVCGAATSPDGVLLSTGSGVLARLTGKHVDEHAVPSYQWDNHLVRIA